MKNILYNWWKTNHDLIRKPLVFLLGISLVMLAPLVGWLPGPGGILIFLLGIAVLGSEFDWALALRAFFTKTVPQEVKKRWRPTPNWQYAFDTASACLFTYSLIFGYYSYWLTAIYSGSAAILLFIFNRNRLDGLKVYLSKAFK